MKIEKIQNNIFLFAVLLLQFYIFKSGSLQPSHILFIISFIFLIIFKGFSKIIFKNITFLRFVIFVFITFLINTIYFLFYNDFDFLISTSYYIFGLIILYLTVYSLLTYFDLANKLIYVLLISIFMLVFLWIIGLGNYEFFPRYNGFFNDPNQMAHWALCVVTMILILNKKSNFINYISIILTSLIVLLSLSRSGLAGLFMIIFSNFLPNKKNIKYIFYFGILLLIIFVFLNLSNTQIFENYDTLISRFLETDFQEQADTRGYGRALVYPEYLIFGSGQARDYRFKSDFEIHSSWMGILFYYGIFTLALVLYNLYTLLIKLNIKNALIVMGPLVYGFSTFGIRTPVFWLLMGVLVYNYITINYPIFKSEKI